MADLIFHVFAWPTFGVALLIFGFAPGAALRLTVLAFSRDDPRRKELVAELYAVPRIERPFWVVEQLEVALLEGLPSRFIRNKANDPLKIQGDRESPGYNGSTACLAAGITYRQLDHFARTGLVAPSVLPAQESDSARLYSFRDVLELRVIKRMLDTGISLRQIRIAVAHLRSRGTDDLALVTLISDGMAVYESSSPDEVVDLLQGGAACSPSRSAASGRKSMAR
jgi:DNA-binding transcriptional MerR regulator